MIIGENIKYFNLGSIRFKLIEFDVPKSIDTNTYNKHTHVFKMKPKYPEFLYIGIYFYRLCQFIIYNPFSNGSYFIEGNRLYSLKIELIIFTNREDFSKSNLTGL